jgi:hypothetical protein
MSDTKQFQRMMSHRSSTAQERLRKKANDRALIKRTNVLKITLTPEEEIEKLDRIKQLHKSVIDDPDSDKSPMAKAIMAAYPPWNLYTDIRDEGSMLRIIGINEICCNDPSRTPIVGLQCVYLKKKDISRRDQSAQTIADNSEVEEALVVDLPSIKEVKSWTVLQQLYAAHFIYPDAFLRAIGFIFLLPNAEAVIRAGADGNIVDLDAIFGRGDR